MKKTMFRSLYNRTNFKKDVLIIILILISPLIIYLHNLVPSVRVIENDYIYLNSIYFEDLKTWAWVVLQKFLYVLIFGLWYITCKHWWRYFLLIPQVFFTIQMLYAFNDDIRFMDDSNLLLGLLFSMPIVVFTYFLGKKTNYYSFSKSLNEDLDIEIEQLIEDISRVQIGNIKLLKEKLRKLRENKSNFERKEYLTKLIELKREFNQ